MNIRLHKNATTTPARRAYIQSSPLSVAALAVELGVSEDTIRRWKKRDTVEDRPHTAHRLQTTLTPAQEAVVLALRETLWLPLDDLLVVSREFINEKVSRSGLQRLLKRHGVSRLPRQSKDEHPHKPFKAYEPGFLHVDVKYLPQMADHWPLSLRGHRPCHALGVHPDQAEQDRGLRQSLPGGPAQGLPDQDPQGTDRQRQGVHRQIVRIEGEIGKRRACV